MHLDSNGPFLPADRRLSCPFSGVQLPRWPVTGAAVIDPNATWGFCAKAERGWHLILAALRPPNETCSEDGRERLKDRIDRM
jgi:hypothetical protein